MDEVFPKKYSVLLLGSPGVGKSEYCLHLMKGYLKNNEKVVYVTTVKSPSEIRDRMKELDVDLGAYEGNSFLFVDVFTRAAGPKDEKVLYVDNPANLNMVSVRISEAAEALGKPVRIIFNSLSTFFLHASESEIRKFFESINIKIKMDYGFALYTLQEEMHDEKMVITLKAMVDAVLEMRLEEAPSLKRKFRVLFAKGITYSQNWVEFQVTKHGFKLAPIGEVPVAKAEVGEVKRKLPLVKVVAFVVLLLVSIAVFQGIFGGKKTAPAIKTSPPLIETKTRAPMGPQPTTVSPMITLAPPVVTAAPTTRPPPITRPPETPRPIVEFRLDGMEDVGNWFPMEGPEALLDITQSTEFSKAGKSMKVSVEILGEEDSFAAIGLIKTQLAGYDGITIWSYVPEPLSLGRLALSLEEKDRSRYMYFRMRSFKKEGWVKDRVPFSGFRLDPWGDNFDENSQLDLDQVEMFSISVGGGPEIPLGTYVFYLDELNLFKYQNISE
ncbi:MAG: RAD55 family ATPase [Candidatus Hydrothermarchaeales archaeon]